MRQEHHHDYALDDAVPPTFKRLSDESSRRPWYFVSLRWSVVLPVALLVVAWVALGAYLIGDALAQSAADREIEHVLATSQLVANRMAGFGMDQQREAARIAYTEGVAEAIQARDARVLHPLIEPLAAAADLDVVIVADTGGREVVGLQRVIRDDDAGDVIDYAVSTGTDLADGPHGSELVRTGQGYALVTGQSIAVGGKLIGSVFVGTRVDRVLDSLRGENGTGLTLYGPGGEFIRTTLPYDDSTRETLALAPELFDQVISSPDQVPVSSLMLQDRPYTAAYISCVINGSAVGVVAVYRADETVYAAWLSRERMALIAALLVTGVIAITFGAMNRVAARVERVTRTADALAEGDDHARTGLAVHDEIGELGAAVDRWAERQQHRAAVLHTHLRQQRAESRRLSAVLAAIPDGLVVQDLEGRVLMINEAARDLLGGQRVFRSARLHDLAAVAADALGPALAPGIYALGDPAEIALEGKILHAQVAAITVGANRDDARRIGTVIVLRDITDDVIREQRREQLLHTLSEQALAPRSPAAYESLSTLAREVVKNTRAIQGVINELRDLSTFSPRDLATAQRPIPANNLLWHVGTEWELSARRAEMQIQVLYGPRELYVLGDERRLRWALGNVVENALKFSPPGATITLAARHMDDHSDNRIEYIVKDQGYGIAPEDMPHVFTRFYRGSPRDLNGQLVRKPGTGQGLFIARRVIESHGGDVSLASRIGKGTTVIVRLPLTSDITFDLPEDDGWLDEIPAIDTSDTQPREAILPPEDEFDTVRIEPQMWDKDE